MSSPLSTLVFCKSSYWSNSLLWMKPIEYPKVEMEEAICQDVARRMRCQTLISFNLGGGSIVNKANKSLAKFIDKYETFYFKPTPIH